MNNVLDDALVSVVLAASVAYAVYSLGPRAWRPRLLAVAAALIGRLPRFFGLQSVARRLDTAGASKATGACGGCDNCGSEAASPAAREAASPAAGRSGVPIEVNVPLSKIGRRSGG